jgi:hypothetical protein
VPLTLYAAEAYTIGKTGDIWISQANVFRAANTDDAKQKADAWVKPGFTNLDVTHLRVRSGNRTLCHRMVRSDKWLRD